MNSESIYNTAAHPVYHVASSTECLGHDLADKERKRSQVVEAGSSVTNWTCRTKVRN